MDDSNIRMRLYSEDHPLEWRIDTSEVPIAIQLVFNKEPDFLKSTKFINVEKGKRNVDGKWSLYFTLKDKRFNEIFALFCKDLIDKSWKINEDNSFDFVFERYEQWRSMFKDQPEAFNKKQIQGLLGELIILRDVMIPNYGEIAALEAWMGSIFGKQDFVCKDMWYEVKSVLEGNDVITVTSAEQLDRFDSGRLVVVCFRQSNKESRLGISIDTVYDELVSVFDNLRSKAILDQKLYALGYEELSEYSEYIFELKNITQYTVGDGFPRIVRSNLAQGICNVNYGINLGQIEKYKVI